MRTSRRACSDIWGRRIAERLKGSEAQRLKGQVCLCEPLSLCAFAPLVHHPPPMNLANIRAQFPALTRTHNSHPVAYFDAPGGTQVPRVVAEAMTDYLFHHNAN